MEGTTGGAGGDGRLGSPLVLVASSRYCRCCVGDGSESLQKEDREVQGEVGELEDADVGSHRFREGTSLSCKVYDCRLSWCAARGLWMFTSCTVHPAQVSPRHAIDHVKLCFTWCGAPWNLSTYE